MTAPCYACEEPADLVVEDREEGARAYCTACAEVERQWRREWCALREGRVEAWVAIVWAIYGGERYGIEKFAEARRWNCVEGTPVTSPIWLGTVARGLALMRERWEREVVCEECGTRFRAELVDVPGGDVMTDHTDGWRRCRWCLMARWARDLRARSRDEEATG